MLADGEWHEVSAEPEQQSGHSNGTLQSAGNALELTIATTLDIPHAYTARGEPYLIDYVSARLGFAVALLPNIKFDVVIGPAGRDSSMFIPRLQRSDDERR